MATAELIQTKVRPLNAYLNLAKSRGILPHFITAAAAMFIAAGGMPLASTLALTLLGGGCVAGAANTFNSYIDRDIDAVMERTKNRPLPSGTVTPAHALGLGLGLGFIGVFILGVFINLVAALLAVGALLYYAIPYTLWLKRHTFWSAIVGSGIGAIPPLIGWTAVTRRIELTPFLLSAVIILWTIPHFWTLAIFRRADYARAGIEALPQKYVNTLINICSFLLVAVTIFLKFEAGLGLLYLIAACLLGAGFLYLALTLSRNKEDRIARMFYIYSIIYIAFLFTAMIVDKAFF
jgi:heme o synthase